MTTGLAPYTRLVQTGPMTSDLPIVDRKGLPRVRREWDGRRVSVTWSVKRGNLHRTTKTATLTGILCATGRDDQIGVRQADGTVRAIHYTRVFTVTLLDATPAERARKADADAAVVADWNRKHAEIDAAETARLELTVGERVGTRVQVVLMMEAADRPNQKAEGTLARQGDDVVLCADDGRVLPVLSPMTRLVNIYRDRDGQEVVAIRPAKKEG